MKKVILFVFLIFSAFLLFSQTLEDDMKIFVNESAKGYIKPLNPAMNASLNSGLFYSAKVLKPFRFSFMINTCFVPIPNSDKTFTAQRPNIDVAGVPLYTPDETQTATIFGNKGSSFNVNGDIYNVSDVDNIDLPDGMNLSVMPFAAPQIGVGLPFGFEFDLRYFPLSIVDSKTFANSYFWGLGVKYGLPLPLPVDLALFANYQNLNAESIVVSDNVSTGVIVGKRLLNFDFYGSLFYSGTNMNVDYETTTVEYQPPTFVTVPIKIKFNLHDNFIKPKLGFTYTLLFFKINAEATFGEYSSYNLGIGLKFP